MADEKQDTEDRVDESLGEEAEQAEKGDGINMADVMDALSKLSEIVKGISERVDKLSDISVDMGEGGTADASEPKDDEELDEELEDALDLDSMDLTV